MKRRVLLIEADGDGRDAVGELLRVFGHEVLAVGTGKEAFKAARTFRPDVMILDLSLSDMDGCDVAKAVHARGGDRPRLIALTGWGRREDQLRARDAGFDVFLLKPCDPELLQAAVLGPTPRRVGTP